MPFAKCRHCLSLFIVGSGEEAARQNRCPYCGSELEPAGSDEVQRRIDQEKLPSPPVKDEVSGPMARRAAQGSADHLPCQAI